MTKRAGHEHEQDQHSLAAAYSDAAVAHDQAARMHEKIADHYDKHGKPARATRERRKATQELQSATADRKWVATLTAGLSDGLDRSSDKSDRPGPHGADLAALLGATIAILLTLTFGPGAWGPLSTIIGLLLLVVLLVFFWGRRPETNRRKKIIAFIKSLLEAENRKYFFEKTRWGLFFVGLTLSVVIGLVAAITSAQLVQWRWFRDDTGYTECRSVAVAQATKAVHDLSDTSTTTVTVGELADTALMSGSTRTESTKLGDAFYHAYDDAIGDCRAGDTFKHLWGVGVFFFVAALFWWGFKFIRSPVKEENDVPGQNAEASESASLTPKPQEPMRHEA